MEQKAFELIQEKLQAALNEQGFGEAVALETDNGRGVMFTTGEVAYGLFYETKQRRFVLRSATMKSPKEPGDWRQLSMWLFDEGENTMQDAESIANDFLELVQGSKRRELVQTAKKRRKKDEENNADPQFFLNRLVPVFPELRDEMNEERIVYGQVRTALFAAEKVAPKCENLAKNYKDSEPMKRMCTIFCDMYAAGDMDTRAVIQFGVLNNIKDEAAIRNIIANFTDGCDLQKVYKHSRKLIGKNIKPEKVKKKGKKVEARLSD